MKCARCNSMNDPAALICANCGAPAPHESPASHAERSRRGYLFALLLIPVIALAAAVGYYKFILPDGVVAVVNGEEITLSELDAEVRRIRGEESAADLRLRYQVLQNMVMERLALQEAKKAGMSITPAELTAALEEARRSSGLDTESFRTVAATEYGSMRNFEEAVAKRLLIEKYIVEKVIPPSAKPDEVDRTVNQWLHDISGRAAVRIALEEQWLGAGCGCCANRRAAASAKGGAGPKDQRSGQPSQKSADMEKASEAAISYWRGKYGDDRITTQVSDFGCHLEINIIKDNKTIGTLRYQGGRISEM